MGEGCAALVKPLMILGKFVDTGCMSLLGESAGISKQGESPHVHQIQKSRGLISVNLPGMLKR